MDILVFAVFAVVCAVIFWGVARHMTNKAIKQMSERTEQVIADMRAETDELMKWLDTDQSGIYPLCCDYIHDTRGFCGDLRENTDCPLQKEDRSCCMNRKRKRRNYESTGQ